MATSSKNKSIPDGYSFRSQLTFEVIRQRLQALGHGEWQERESAWYGDYLSGSLWGVRMRIFDRQGTVSEAGSYDPKGFMLLDYARDSKASAEQDVRIRTELFPQLEVIEWRLDERND